MSALYWDDFDCTPESRAIAHPSTAHVHVATEREACTEFLRVLGSPGAPHDGRLYWCVRGPRGLVRGVRL